MVIVSVKTSFLGEVRRTTFDTETNFRQLSENIKRTFQISPATSISICYRDEDEDEIKVTSDIELTEAFTLAQRGNSVIHFFVTGVASDKFVNSPPKQVVVPSFVGFEQKQNQNKDVVNSILPQFFGVPNPESAPIDLSSSTMNPSQQLFSSFGTLLNAVPKEQLTQITSGLMINPMVNQLLSQLLVSLSAMSIPSTVPQANQQTQTQQAPKSKPSFVTHDAICDVCSQRIVGIRYKCAICIDFDLCESCESKEGVHEESHSLIKFKRAIQAPQAIHPIASVSNSAINSQNVLPVLDSDFVCDVSVPDKTVIPLATKFIKVWRLQNNGNVKWPQGTRLILVAGDSLGQRGEVHVPELEPKAQIDISVECMSPSQPGRYVGYWRLVNSESVQFGCKIWVDVVAEKSKEQGLFELHQKEQEAIRKEREQNERAEQLRKEKLEVEEQQRQVQLQHLKDQMMKAQQEQLLKVQQEQLLMKSQQEQLLKVQQEQLLRAQQEQLLKSQQEQLLKSQQEQLLKAQQEKEQLLKVQQEKEKLLKSQQKPNEFEESLRQLEDMGFRNRELTVQLLIKHNRDIVKVVAELLNSV